MKFYLSQLRKLVTLHQSKIEELRFLMDDLGLEVKNIQEEDNDHIFTLELLSNRGDHHGLLGIARELAARHLGKINWPSMATLDESRKISFPVRVRSPKCFKYELLEMILPETIMLRPEIKDSLFTAPKHPLVDTVNYVQKELGQPMHAFDKDKVKGEVVVTELTEETEIVALDDNTYTVPAGALVIRDRERILAVAGVIGCANSAVGEGTRRVLLESATFDPVSIRTTARAMGLVTDSSKVFERGADVEMVRYGIKRVIQLLSGAGGATGSGSIQVIGISIHDSRELVPIVIKEFHLDEVRRHIGSPRLPAIDIVKRLESLGFKVETIKKEKVVKVEVPSWRRWDVGTQQDLVEEFVRVFGYERVKQKGISFEPVNLSVPLSQQVQSRVRQELHGRGFLEIITQSFYSENEVEELKALNVRIVDAHIRLLNSLEKAHSAMRITPALHIADVVAYNQRLGVKGIKVYEHCRVFSKGSDDGSDLERDVLVCAWVGPWYQGIHVPNERGVQRSQLFKGSLTSIFDFLGVHPTYRSSDNGLFHPGVRAEIMVGNKKVGTIGFLHPSITSKRKIKGECCYAELDPNVLVEAATAKLYSPPSVFPSIERDVTVFLPNRISSGDVCRGIDRLKIEHLVSVEVKDWFQKDGEKECRVTFRTTFRSDSETLSGEAADEGMQSVFEYLTQKKGLSLVQ